MLEGAALLRGRAWSQEGRDSGGGVMSSWTAPYPPWQVSAGCQGTLLSAAPLTRGQVRGWR